MNPDGVSYLDMTDLLLRGDYRPLAHSYWSPLYPCLLALLLKVSSASSETEDVIVHLGNGLVGLAALASFTFLVVQWQHLRVANQKTDLSLVAFRLRLAFAYLMFLWATIQMIGLALVTPDLCVAALVYLAAALCCRMAVGSGGWGTSALLGAVASLAYFGKAAMAPLGAALLVLLAIPRISPLLRRKHLIAAAPIFAAAVGAHVFVVSRQTHHFSFAEVGRLAYAWLVGREIPAYVGWTGDPPGTGPPIHAPRVLSVKPKVLEFRNTVPGTYPLWYDPAYFHDGLRTHFDWRKEVPTLYQSLFNIRRVQQPNFNPLVAGLCVLWLLAVRSGGAGVDFSKPWLILWPLAAFSMFALVLIEGRFIAPFLVLFWISAYDAVSPGSLGLAQRGVIGVVAGAILVAQGIFLSPALAEMRRASGTSVQLSVARELGRLGLRAGDEIATLGYPFSMYYARLARLHIVANVAFQDDDAPEETERFWALSEQDRNTLNERLRQVGVKAIVSSDRCIVTASNGWHAIGGTGYCVQMLN